MQIDSIKYPIHSLGPGNRLVIWTIGCSKKCKNCISPRLQTPNPNMNVNINELYEYIETILDGENVDGITISGGDPFIQKDELLELIKLLNKLSKDILIYTGYTFEEIKEMLSKEEIDFIQNNIAALIDGPYIDKLNDNKSALRGSTNQRLLMFNHKFYDIYGEYEKEGRKIEIFNEDSGIRIVGIQNKEKVK